MKYINPFLHKVISAMLLVMIGLSTSTVRPVLAAPGDIDTTFNYGTGTRGTNGTVYAVAVQVDGKVVIGGNFNQYNGVAVPSGIIRLNTDGLLDTTFNNGGAGIGGGTSTVYALAIDASGNILVGGNFNQYNGVATPFGLIRITSNGTQDATFNNGGAGLSGGAAGPAAYAIAIQPSDGKILVGGNFTAYNGDTASPDNIMRVNTNGARDTTGFISGVNAGVVKTISGIGGPPVVYAVAVQPDGKILVGGDWFNAYSNDGITIDTTASDNFQRLNANGTLDTTFNYGTTDGFNAAVRAIAVQASDSRIVLGGLFTSYNGDAAVPDDVLRVNTDGSRDTGFIYGAGSGVINTINANGDAVYALAIQPDGKILVGGGLFNAFSNNGSANDLQAPDDLLRLNPNGTLDTTFNYGSGVRGSNNIVYALAIQPLAPAPYNSKAWMGGNFVSYNGDANAPDRVARIDMGLVVPTVTINQASGQVDPTNNSPVHFTVVFSEAVTGFGSGVGDVTLSGSAGATTATVTEIAPNNGTTYDVAVNGMTDDGTVIATVPAGAATNGGGTGNSASTSTDNTVIYDTTSPTVTVNKAAGQADPTNILPVTFTVIFSEPINPATFTTADITEGGTATGITWSLTNSGDNRNFTLSATAVTSAGFLVPNIAAGSVQDPAGNNNTASASTDNSVLYDATNPTVTINQAAGQVDPTNSSPINFTVVFDEAVTGFGNGAGDVTLSGTAGATTATVTEIVPNDGTTYNVAVSGMTIDGTVIATVPAGIAMDLSSNSNSASSSTDNTVTYDTTGPTVTINQAAGQADPTGSSPINFTVVFSEAVTGFGSGPGDVTLSGTAGATTATITEIAPNDGTTYNVAVSGMSGNGTVIASIMEGVATGTDGNTNSASTSTDDTVTYAPVGPTVIINQAAGQADPTNASPVNFTVVFSEAVTGFGSEAGDVTLSGSASATTATVTEIAPNDGTTYNVAVSGMSTDGTVSATVPEGAATNSVGTGSNASTSTDNTVTYNTTGPTVTINQAAGQADPTGSSPINFDVVFSEDVTGFDENDVTLGGTAGATTAVVTGSGSTFSIAVSGMTVNGTVTASIPAGAAADNVGNGNSASTSTDNTVNFDTTGPAVTIDQAAGQLDPTSVSPINFTVVFAEPVTGFITGDVSLSGTAGATTATVTEVAPNNGTTFNVAVIGMSSGGTVIASIPAGRAQNAMGNGNQASTSTDNTVTYDLGYPTVSSSTPANNGTVSPGPTKLTVQFSEDVKNDGSAGAANNTANYLLVERGANNTFDTLSCAAGVVSDDTKITINSAAYTNNGGSGPFAVTLNLTTALPVGSYQLFVCGTTSIEDLANNELNNGLSDSIVTFNVTVRSRSSSSVLPKTGFPMDKVTALPVQPVDQAYASTDLMLEIPRLGVKMSIVGVPFKEGGWDVSWLDKNAGWLNSSAFPTWNGNSVITGHVWDALNRPGPFAGLKDLKYGDQIKIHAFGQVFTYEVRESSLISPASTATVFTHKEKSWITLVTCEDYKEATQEYLYRRMVRAVLIKVTAEK